MEDTIEDVYHVTRGIIRIPIGVEDLVHEDEEGIGSVDSKPVRSPDTADMKPARQLTRRPMC